MLREGPLGTDRGVSETVGFVLVFSLVVASVGTVYAVGYTGLEDARDGERVDNAQRAFEVLAYNVEDLTHRGAHSRATEIRLAEADLRTGTPTRVNVSGDYRTDNASQEMDFYTGNVTLTPLVYRAGGSTDRIRYVGGAVLRGRETMTFVEEPEFVVDDDRVLIPVVQTSVSGSRSVGGSTTVLVRTERTLSDVVVAEVDEYDAVTVRLHTPYVRPWRRYFEARGLSCVTPDADTLECTATDVGRVYVVIYDVEVTLE